MINWQNGTTPINETNMNKLVQEDMITDAYSSSSTYAVGDYCIYGNTLYKCTTAITTAEAWNSAHWTAVSVADEINARVKKSGDTMTGNLKMESNSVEWKETNYGDKFRIIPDFNGAGSSNRLLVQSTVGDAGTDPTNWKTLVSIHAETGEVDFNANDTGWVDMTSCINTDYMAARPGFEPKARRIGDTVYWSGEVYITNSPSNPSNFTIMKNIPEQFQNDGTQINGYGSTYENFIKYSIWIGNGTTIQCSIENGATQQDYKGISLSSLIYIAKE